MPDFIGPIAAIIGLSRNSLSPAATTAVVQASPSCCGHATF